MFVHLSPLTIHQLFFSFEKGNDSVRERGIWKFNKSLISESKYIESIKKHICDTLCLLGNQHITDERRRWKYLKYETREFTATFIAENA